MPAPKALCLPTAAYLYVLHLDGPSLAWEYLRRNPQYRRECTRQHHCKKPDTNASHRWGLRLFEDPARDARDAQPDWMPDPDRLVLIHPDLDPSTEASQFDIWRLPGYKHLTHDGRRLVLTCQLTGHTLRMAISPMLDVGMAYVCAVRAGTRLCRRWRDIETELALLDNAPDPVAISASRPGRTALLHMRTLQALDSMQAGASHREVAETLFGAASVADRWNDDSELRAQVRRLIRRGRAVMAGDYRRLLHIGSVREGR